MASRSKKKKQQKKEREDHINGLITWYDKVIATLESIKKDMEG